MFKYGIWAGASAGIGQNKGTVFKIASTVLLPKVGEMSWCFSTGAFYFFLFFELLQV